MKQTQQTLISDLEKLTSYLILLTEQSFSELEKAQLNWKPSAEKWSIAECLEHLNLYGDYYLDAIEHAIVNAKKMGSAAGQIYRPGWLGNYFANSMKPQNGKPKSKMHSPKDKNPVQSQVPENVVERFLEQQNRILGLLEKAKHSSFSANRIPITLSRFIKLKLGDTFRFVLYHNERHVMQAMRVLEVLKRSN